MYKLFASSQFPRSLGVFPHNCGSPREEKNSWMKREKPQHVLKSPAVAAARQRRVYIFGVTICVAAD